MLHYSIIWNIGHPRWSRIRAPGKISSALYQQGTKDLGVDGDKNNIVSVLNDEPIAANSIHDSVLDVKPLPIPCSHRWEHTSHDARSGIIHHCALISGCRVPYGFLHDRRLGGCAVTPPTVQDDRCVDSGWYRLSFVVHTSVVSRRGIGLLSSAASS